MNFPDPQAIREAVEASAAWLKRLVDAEIYAVLIVGSDIADSVSDKGVAESRVRTGHELCS